MKKLIYSLTIVLILGMLLFSSVALVFGEELGATTSSRIEELKKKDETARSRYQEARGNFLKEVNFYKNAKNDLSKARENFRKLKNEENKKIFEDKARSFLVNVVRAMIKRLEALRTKVSNTPHIAEAERQAILAEIDKDINWLKEREAKIATATPEQIKEEAKTVRGYWKNIRLTAKKTLGRIAAARVGFAIAKAEEAAAKLEAKINELKSAGHDTAGLEQLLSNFKTHLAVAKEKFESAKAKFKEISSFDSAGALLREGFALVKEANEHIREAHKVLVSLIKEIRKTEKSAGSGATSTVSTTTAD